MFRKTPLDQFSTHLYEKVTHKEINLSYSLMNPRSNDFSSGRSFISKLVPLPSVDLSKYFIQVRESQSQWVTLLGIPITLVGAFGVIGGFVLGLLADQLFI